MRHSPAVSEVLQDLFAGTQSYRELKTRLMGRAKQTVFEVMQSLVLRRRFAEETK